MNLNHVNSDINLLGGMWGFYNERERQLGQEIFRTLMNESIARKHHESGTEMIKGLDQFFLHDHVYPLIKTRSVIHDSYLCKHIMIACRFRLKELVFAM